MWIKGLGGLYFTGSESEGGATLYGYASIGNGFTRYPTDAGSRITPYSDVVQVFGEFMVSGRAVGAQGDGVVYELYRLDRDGSLSIFADIEPGPASSLFDPDKLVPGVEHEVRVLAVMGGGDRFPYFCILTDLLKTFQLRLLVLIRLQDSIRHTPLKLVFCPVT